MAEVGRPLTPEGREVQVLGQFTLADLLGLRQQCRRLSLDRAYRIQDGIAIGPEVVVELLGLAVVVDDPGVILGVAESPLHARRQVAFVVGLQADAELLDSRPDLPDELGLRMCRDLSARTALHVRQSFQPTVVEVEHEVEQGYPVFVDVWTFFLGHGADFREWAAA